MVDNIASLSWAKARLFPISVCSSSSLPGPVGSRAGFRLPRPLSLGERDFEKTLPLLPGLHAGPETMNLT